MGIAYAMIMSTVGCCQECMSRQRQLMRSCCSLILPIRFYLSQPRRTLAHKTQMLMTISACMCGTKFSTSLEYRVYIQLVSEADSQQGGGGGGVSLVQLQFAVHMYLGRSA